MTINQFISSVQKVFRSELYSEQEKIYILKLFICDFYKINKAKLVLIQNENASLELMKYLERVVIRLNQNEPFQYILEKENFYGYDFYVNEHVLIPRPETEELVEWILDATDKNTQVKILDIGTGSGCIPITIQKENPIFEVSAFDISKEALQVANKNNILLETNVQFYCLDILNEDLWQQIDFYDVIVSNPPYIPNREKDLMQENVLSYEPSIALFVENDDELIFYKKIVTLALQKLNSNGLLFFECNEFNALVVKDYLEKNGFINIELKKDIYGKNRMIKAIKL